MKVKKMNATILRTILVIVIVLLAGGIGAGFYFLYGQLQTVATDVSHTTADAAASDNNIQTLQALEKELKEKSAAIERVSKIVATTKNYQYQDQIITDLNGYASASGISIKRYDFKVATPAATPTTSPSTGTATTPVTTAGPKSTFVTITLDEGIQYSNLLKFLYAIEDNLTKMQLSGVNISKSTTGGVTVGNLTLEVYIQ